MRDYNQASFIFAVVLACLNVLLLLFYTLTVLK